MTIAEAKHELASLGIELRKGYRSYIVNTFNGSNATATVHDNLMDAYETGKAQANISRAITFTLVNSKEIL